MKIILTKLYHDFLDVAGFLINRNTVITLALLVAIAALSVLIGYLNYPVQ